MKTAKLSSVFLSVTLLCVSASAQADIRKVDFQNFTYPSDCRPEGSEAVTVKNGEYSIEKEMEGYTDRFYFRVFPPAFGDLTGDGREEAVVISVCNTGGTGNFTEGMIYSMSGEKPSLIARIPGGDRAYGGLREARVENGILVVESNDVGELGGACCPEFVVTTRYRVVDGKLVPQGVAARRDLYPKERISFAKGTSGKTFKVKVPGQEFRRFVVGARAGQVLTVSVDSDDAKLRLLESANVTDGINNFLARLPVSRDYTIEIYNAGDGPAEFTVNVRIR